MLELTRKDIDRFWSKVDKTSNPDDCWEWFAGKDKSGYGKITINYKSYRSHRVSYELNHGIFDYKLDVLHTCDKPACVNPNHLFLGTQKDNANDMVKKNRQAIGEKHGSRTHPEKIPYGERHANSKLTKKQVKEIKTLFGLVTISDIARKYNVSRKTIRNIKDEKIWKHI